MLFSTAKRTSSRLYYYREMLEESVSDLRSTMCELQDRLHSVDGQGEFRIPLTYLIKKKVYSRSCHRDPLWQHVTQ